MNYDRTERLRRAAILVASVEQSLAEQMLAALPPQEAARLLAVVEGLGEIDPEEHEDVLEEFRRTSRRGAGAEQAVEFTYSVPRVDLKAAAASNASSAAAAGPAAPASPLHNADVGAIARLLVDEHPQTIAAAVSRLGDDQAAEVFAALPTDLQADVLERLVRLQAANEDAVLDVESQLARKLELHREHRQQAAAGVELARRIIARTDPHRRAALLNHLSSLGPAAEDVQRPAATKNQTGVEQAPIHAMQQAQQAANLAAIVQRTRQLPTAASSVGAPSATSATPSSPNDHADRSTELESLPDHILLVALRLAPDQVVQRALAASSEQFVNRITARLSRKQALKLRKLMRALGPTRLADLRQAQFELLQFAESAASQSNERISAAA